jgi:hypothetical protein
VLAILVLGGGHKFVLGGSFLSAGEGGGSRSGDGGGGGRMRVNHVALYDSENVHKLGNGVDGAVHALVELDDGDVVAAGVPSLYLL